MYDHDCVFAHLLNIDVHVMSFWWAVCALLTGIKSANIKSSCFLANLRTYHNIRSNCKSYGG